MGLLLAEAVLVVVFFKDPLALHAASTEETIVGENEGGEEKKDGVKEQEA